MNPRAFLCHMCSPTAVASDLEAQRQHASIAECRMPPPAHHRARGTVASIVSSIPTREEVDAYFVVLQPTLVRGTTLSRHDFGPMQSAIMPDIPPEYQSPTVESGSAEGHSATGSKWAQRVLCAAFIIVALTGVVLVTIHV